MLLEGKRIIITGGLSGIGEAAVYLAAEEGAIVLASSRKDAAHPDAKAMIAKAAEIKSGSVSYAQMDVTSKEQVDQVFDEAVAKMGGLDVVINCAGLDQQILAEDVTRDDVMFMMDIHLMGTIYTNQAAFRYMKEIGGALVNVASSAGVEPFALASTYSCAKAAVIAWTRHIAQNWGQYMIRANAVCPSCMTKMLKEHIDAMTDEERAAFIAWEKANILLGDTYGSPRQCAELMIYLASDYASIVHGQLVAADSGIFMPR